MEINFIKQCIVKQDIDLTEVQKYYNSMKLCKCYFILYSNTKLNLKKYFLIINTMSDFFNVLIQFKNIKKYINRIHS